MRTVEVEITEILQKRVIVKISEGKSMEDALKRVEELYNKDKLKLETKDFVDVSFGIVN